MDFAPCPGYGPAAAMTHHDGISDREMRHSDRLARNKPPIGEHRHTRLVCDRHFAYIPRTVYFGKDVLDACCGEARSTQFMAEDGSRRCLGIDISRD